MANTGNVLIRLKPRGCRTFGHDGFIIDARNVYLASPEVAETLLEVEVKGKKIFEVITVTQFITSASDPARAQSMIISATSIPNSMLNVTTPKKLNTAKYLKSSSSGLQSILQMAIDGNLKLSEDDQRFLRLKAAQSGAGVGSAPAESLEEENKALNSRLSQLEAAMAALSMASLANATEGRKVDTDKILQKIVAPKEGNTAPDADELQEFIDANLFSDAETMERFGFEADLPAPVVSQPPKPKAAKTVNATPKKPRGRPTLRGGEATSTK